MFNPMVNLARAVLGDHDELLPSSEVRLMDDVERARKDWRAAQVYFDQVKDFQEVDFASYNLKSAEQRYMNLWHEARKLGLKAWISE